MSIERLTRLVPPPASPAEVGSLDQWAAAEDELGIVLPPDYREFVFAYGSGLFAGLYVVYNPFANSPLIRLKDRAEQLCAIERQVKQGGIVKVPYPIFPEPGGILPWGCDENGNYYYWLTEGAPAAWPVIQNSVRGTGYARHDCSMTVFLANVLEGKIQALASGYPRPENFVFHPYQLDRRPWWRFWG